MAEEWRLRDEQGSVRSLTTQELRDGLARGVIPSSALVSRPGGKDFAPAFSVPELATAAIRAKRTPSMPPGAANWLAKAPAPGGATGGGAKSAPEVPAAPRSRRRIAHTLVGIQGDEDDAPAPTSLGAPIVAPGAGGTPLGAPRAITQVPRYTPSPISSTPASDDVVIPRAPRAPGSTSLTVTDHGWEEPGENASIFDGEEDAQTLVKKSEPPKRPPPKPPGRPPAPPLARPGDASRRPSQQPPPLPPKRDAGKPPARPTVMGLGMGGARIQPPPRAPLKSASTPPPSPVGPAPAAARPVSKPPPAPPLKRTPQPPAVAAKPIVDEPTIPIADEKTDVTPAPDAVVAATASPKAPPATTSPKPPATTSPKPPAVTSAKPPATTSAKPPATTSAKPPAATTSAKPPAVGPMPSTQETLTGGLAAPAAELAAAAIASGAVAAATSSPPAVEGTPTVPMPEAREAKPGEGTPTVPMPEVRASLADVDEAPTSKMAVQIVHGAAMAMRAALAAPKHEAPGTSSSSPPEAVPPSAMPPVSSSSGEPAAAAKSGPASAPVSGPVSAPVSRPSPEPSSLAPSSGASAAADLESALASGSTSAKLPRPPRTPGESRTTRESGATSRDGASSSTPLMGSTPPPAANDDDEAPPHSGVEVPVSSLFAASGVWIAGLILVFFVGRCSAIEARPPAVRSAIGTAARLAFLRAAPGTSSGGGAELRACNVSRRPTRWAAAASKNVPFEMAPAAGGAAMFVGYGAGDEGAVGLKIDPKTGKFDKVFDENVSSGVVRVTPLPGASPDDAATFFATPKADTTLVPVAGSKPEVWVRFGEGGIESLPAKDGSATMAFPFQGGDRTNAEQVLGTSAGVYLSFRRGEGIMGGWLDASGKPKGDLASVVGSGGKVGKPRASWNGKEVAVAFADKPDGSPWQVRVGHAAAGAVPTTTKAFDLPAGGPGGDAIAPDIVGLPDGRWILMWTEGAAGNRAIQSITLGPDFAPIGDAIALSPPSGNFGQAQLGVVGRYVTVLFLQKGDEDFELWGAVLQCG